MSIVRDETYLIYQILSQSCILGMFFSRMAYMATCTKYTNPSLVVTSHENKDFHTDCNQKKTIQSENRILGNFFRINSILLFHNS